MNECIIFLDESGDLGWKFDAPYRFGGSSRYLTIASVLAPKNKSHLLSRAIKELYKKFDWNIKKEKKWTRMNRAEKYYFAKSVFQLAKEHNDIKFLSITTYKPNLDKLIHDNPNKLYNYMIGVMLLSEISGFDRIIFTPDLRGIKVEHDNSLYDYLMTKILLELGYKLEFINNPMNSSHNKGIQFADMIAGIIQQHFEDNDSECFHFLPKDKIKIQTVFMANEALEKKSILVEEIT